MIIPVPSHHGKPITQWQQEVTEYLTSIQEHLNATNPVQLTHMMGNESAVVEGILMYDPATGEVVVSDGTQYRRLAFAP